MTKKLFTMAVVILFFSFVANAQLLWKISGKGLGKPSYLFGTHHLIEKEQIKNFDKALDLCKASDMMIGEVDLSDIAAMQTALMQGSVMQGTTCKDLMSVEDYALVDNEFKQVIGVGLEQLGVMKPMMLNTLYSVTVYLKSNNITKQPQAVDMVFQKTAKENNKKVMGLETTQDQIDALFNALPLKRQAEILVKSVKEKEKGIQLLKNLNEIYLEGDLKKAEKLFNDDDSMTPEERKPILDNRNNNWMKALPALMKEGQCFVAVGLGHLVGEVGLIHQLQKAGYKVEAVEM